MMIVDKEKFVQHKLTQKIMYVYRAVGVNNEKSNINLNGCCTVSF